MTLEPIEGFTTEGVMIIANITKCKAYYANKDFDYRYAEGLEELIKGGIIHIVTTDEDVEVVELTFDKSDINPDTFKHLESYNFLSVDKGDEVRAISHADFTQMCDAHKGDFNAQVDSSLRIRNAISPEKPRTKEYLLEYDYPEVPLPEGNWRVNVYASTEGNVSRCAEFFYHFEKMNSVDAAKITLEPIEFYGG